MPQALQYASTPAAPRFIVWDDGPDGVTITLPPRPIWPSAMALAAGAAVAAALLTAVGAAAVAVWRRPLVDFPAALLSAVGVAVMGWGLVYVLRRLVGLPLVGQVSTVIVASASGLLVTSAATGRLRDYRFARDAIDTVWAEPGPWTTSLRRTVYLYVQRRDGRTTFEFSTREPGVPERLEAAILRATGRPPTTSHRWPGFVVIAIPL